MYKKIKYLLIFPFTMGFILCYAQNKSGKIIYTLTSKDNSLKNGGGVLYFDQNHSLYIIHTEKKEQTTITKSSDGSVIHPSNTVDSIANKTRFIYYDQVNKIFYNNIINNNTETILKDNTKISWKLTKETKKIEGYKCHKAVGKLYDIEYEVWFTEKLKFPYGPIKINGLEGIILEMNSNSIGLKISAEKIYLDHEDISDFIKEFNNKYDYSDTKTREEYDKIISNQIKKQ